MEPLASLTIDTFLERLASKEPVPGGGAAAGVVGATGAALALMAANYSIGRKSLVAQPELEQIAAELRGLRGVFLVGADLDAKAYAELSALWKLPKTDPKRAERWTRTVVHAMAVPKSIIGSAMTLLEVCARLAPICNPNLLSDLAGAASLAEACVRAAGQNVRVNAALLDDNDAAEQILIELERQRLRAATLRAEVERACGS